MSSTSWWKVAVFTLLSLSIVLASSAGAAAEAEEPEPVSVPVTSWLVAGPVPSPLPALAGDEAKPADLLAEAWMEPPEPWPAAGDRLVWAAGQELTWEERRAGDGGALELAGGEGPRSAILAAYLTTRRFVKAELTVTTSHLVRVLLDGEEVASKTSVDESRDDGEPEKVGEATAEITLPTGKHLLTIQAVQDPGGPAGWSVAAELSVTPDHASAVAAGTSPRRGVTMADLLDVPNIDGVTVSADGELVAVRLQLPSIPAEEREEWVEVRRAGNGEIVRSFRGGAKIYDFQWGPGRRFSYVTRDGGKATLWVGDLAGGETRPLLSGVDGLGGYDWSDDGTFLVYTTSPEPPDDKRGAKRFEGLNDRWSGWRAKDRLHQVSVADGTRRRLTGGEHSTTLDDIAPDGSRLLFTRTVYGTERPFAKSELYELDLTTLGASLLSEVYWLNGARYSPDGKRILLAAGPSAFGEAGRDVLSEVTPNEYEGELYLLDRGSGEVVALTRDFDPAVDQAAWAGDGEIYLRVTEGSGMRLYRYRLSDRSFRSVDAGLDVVDDFDLSRGGKTIAYSGSSATTPPQVRVIAGGSPKTIFEPGAERYAQVDFGRVEDWSFETDDGDTILGRVHYPPDFDPAKKYPLLVYYYSGVVPTLRSFGGRYPKNFWTANGYVVYVLQPSGTVGFGQEFAARHVNDWGKRVAGEIVAGVEAFVEAHPFVDPERIGNFGGSYGGFMTMLLITETDLFSAAISHAGISSISSYWGEGWWGYLYSAVAGADSYPWNNPDLYVGQSPLFRADRIETPLLLLHGGADPNVPPGESQQMYTALTLLGKEVELIEIEGEAHWILSYPKRVLWWQSIMAWFDKHLKGEPEWWEELWGKD